MTKIEVNVQTGEVRTLLTTAEEQAQAEAATAASASDARAREIAAKRAAALRALDDKRLALAATDPTAPQEVKDYAAAVKQP